MTVSFFVQLKLEGVCRGRGALNRVEDSHFHTRTNNPTPQTDVMQNTKAFGIRGFVIAALKNPDMDSVAPGDDVWTSK